LNNDDFRQMRRMSMRSAVLDQGAVEDRIYGCSPLNDSCTLSI